MQWLFNISFIRDDGRKDETQHSVSVLTIRLYNLAPSCLFFLQRDVLETEKSEFELLQAVEENASYILQFCLYKDITQKSVG